VEEEMMSENRMTEEQSRSLSDRKKKSLLAVFAALITVLIVACASQSASEHQQMIHEMGSNVMPFDLAKTQHVFEMTEKGGIQQVIIRDQKYSDQLVAVRQHLRHEAMLFSMGDYSDPTTLHGKDMPGIKELQAGFSQINVSYSELGNGAQLTFETSDMHLVTAIHRWFGAQLSDHGADATYK
jgi:hypothetical protein